MLPLAEEIREARALSDEAYFATLLTAPMTMVKILLQQLFEDHSPRGDAELPGDKFIEDSCLRWGLTVPPMPRPEASMHEHVIARSKQIEAIEAFVQQIADTYIDRTVYLNGLIHDQFHLLEDPIFGTTSQDIADLDAQRTKLLEEVGPLQARQTGLSPLIAALGQYRPIVEMALASDDPVFWRGCADALRTGILDVAISAEQPIEPPKYDEDARRDLLQLQAWFVETRVALEAESAASMLVLTDIAARYAAITEQMQGQTG